VLSTLGTNAGLEIHHDGDLPAHSGLGSSSSFTVGLINSLNALKGLQASKEDLAKQAIYIEQEVIKENVGSQDQISAAFGGFNKIDFNTDDSFNITPVIISKDLTEKLQDHILLFFTGLSRFSSEIAKDKIANIKNHFRELTQIKEMVNEGLSILYRPSDSIKDLGKLLHESWKLKRSLSTKVSTPKIDEIYETGIKAGAIGGKILGAGGGGFILFFAAPENHNKIIDRLKRLVHVAFKFDNTGSKIVVYEPNGFK
ncbi:MAG: kinase, partial [Nitrospina sp.]|nr:kinase [Nitrospina sp.]